MKIIAFCLASLFLAWAEPTPEEIELQHKRSAEEKATAEAAFSKVKEALKFECEADLAKPGKKPKLILSGETHDDPYCKADRCQKLAEGACGKCFVGVEGVYCMDEEQAKDCLATHGVKPTAENRVFGYEDSFAFGLGLLLVQDLEFHVGVATKDSKVLARSKRTLLLEATWNAYLKDVWKKMRKKTPAFADSGAEAVAKIIEANLEGGNRAAGAALDGLSADHPWNQNHPAFKEVLHAWTRAYLDMVDSKRYRLDKWVPPNVRPLVEAHLAGKDYATPMEILLEEWRNLFLAKNLAKLYCAALKEGPEGKDLHVIVGNRHVEKLARLLGQMSGGRVPIEKRNSKEEVQKLLHLDRNRGKTPYADKPITIESAPKFDGGLPEYVVQQKGGKRFVLHLKDGTSENKWGPGGRTSPLWTVGSISVLQNGIEVGTEEERAAFLAEVRKSAEADAKLRAALEGAKIALK